MTRESQDRAMGREIARMRALLDQVEMAQRDGDALLAMDLADGLAERADAIMWSAVANARTVPGTSWSVIGGRLKLSRQGAQQRFS